MSISHSPEQQMSQRLSQPQPTTAKTADGRVIPVTLNFGSGPPTNRKLLIVLGYYEQDKSQAEELAELICDLERIRNRDADFMMYRRFDATEPSRQIQEKLQDKFEKVHLLACRRKDGASYPSAPNQMYYDLVTTFGQTPLWLNQYYAWLNLEPDCVPLRPGWISELIAGFKSAESRGAACIGFIHNDPIRHMNGVAVYSTDFYQRVPGGKLGGGSLSITYDINQARNIIPIAEDSALIHFDYRRPTIVPEDLFGPKRDNTEPALYHGVKDRSARDAVRERFVTFAGHRSLVNKNVFTYFTPTLPGMQDPEANAILRLWQEGWRSRGWNPIVLRVMDATRNRRYRDFLEAIQRLKTKGSAQIQQNRFMRWLALDTMGGSFLTDYDVLPGDFTPEIAENSKGFAMVDGQLSAAIVDRPTLGSWITEIKNYSPLPEDLGDVSDGSVLAFMRSEARIEPAAGMKVAQYAGGKMEGAQMVHFSRKAILATPFKTKRKSELMEGFLRGT